MDFSGGVSLKNADPENTAISMTRVSPVSTGKPEGEATVAGICPEVVTTARITREISRNASL
jgi:hypothetical protein